MKALDLLLAAAEAFGEADRAVTVITRAWDRGMDRGPLEAAIDARRSASAELSRAAKAYATATRKRRRPA